MKRQYQIEPQRAVTCSSSAGSPWKKNPKIQMILPLAEIVGLLPSKA